MRLYMDHCTQNTITHIRQILVNNAKIYRIHCKVRLKIANAIIIQKKLFALDKMYFTREDGILNCIKYLICV